MTTGEQPKAEPALTLSFDRILVLAGLVGSLAVAYGGYAVSRSNVEAHEKRIEKLETSADLEKDAHNSLTTRVAVVEAAVFDIKAALGRIEGKLDGKTTNAVYRQPRGPTP